MNQNFYNSNSFGFDQIQPPQQFDNHQPQEIPEVVPFFDSETRNELYKMMEAYTERMKQQREQETLLAAQREQELLTQKQAAQEEEELSPNSVFRQLIEETCGMKVCEEQKQKLEDTMLELLEDCQQKEIYQIHDDVEDIIGITLNSKLLSIKSKSQRLVQEQQEVKNIVKPEAKRQTRITPCLKNFKIITKESIIPLNNTPQISPVNAITHDLPSEYDLPVNDESSPIFTTFSNHLFDSNDDFTSSDDESLFNEDIPMENFKIYSNPLFDDEEIIPTNIDPHSFNAESNHIESLLNRDTLIDSSLKFDYLLEEFSGELAHIDPIPSGIEKADFDLEEEIRLAENLSYDNSSPRHPEELNLDMILESLPPPPIPIEDSDSRMEEIDLFLLPMT
ncbi:hypothetical protein Tco_1318540 [Tanacetum coccineum]